MIRMSQHAIDRALDMAVSGDEIRRCLEQPEQVRFSPSHPGVPIHVRGRLAIPVAQGVATTILWRYEKQRASDLHRADFAGRDPRGKAERCGLDPHQQPRQQKRPTPKHRKGRPHRDGWES